ncbi:(Fe-S)-binding protein [Pseudaquidulcibacter saccharophilus]|uniref:(Fe-S)-binding protein n=1 Tax=Pseudaquidulcibacter saccharophilus TaxID=2831900 RepID=UPI001EFF3D1F|nr:(Fe-S)-binding protein [Pseudaquidulcibacter saccharophilus]
MENNNPTPKPKDANKAVEKFLVSSASQLAPYLEACIHCGQCAHACHFYEVTQDPKYTPAYKLFPMIKAYRRSKNPLNWLGMIPTLEEDEIAEWQDLVFNGCTMCGRCTNVCPMGIDVAQIVGATRQALTAAGYYPEDLMAAAENVVQHGSPLKVSTSVLEDRLEWIADESETDIPLDKKGAEVMFTISSIELMKYPDSVGAMAKMLNAAGVNWTISTKGYESTNFGYLAGRPDIAKLGTSRLVNAAEELGVKELIIPECGHAYSVLRWNGANIMGRPLGFKVYHITEYLAKLKREGKLKFKSIETAFTYHDPCQISRRGGAADDARYLLEGFAPNFVEMKVTGNQNWCCGGGGGVQAMNKYRDMRINVFKIKAKQVEETGTNTMISACANCRLTMDESIAELKWGGKLDSLVEILADNLIED